jgi:hypothetical protein
MAVTVDQSKLVLNAFAATFQNNLVAADAVSWKQYDGEMNDRNGLTVVEQVGPRYTVTQTTDGIQDLSGGVQSTVFGSEQFKVNTVFTTSMGYGDFVKVRDLGDARENEAIKSAATNLAESIDAYVLRTAILASNNWVGTPGTDIDEYSDFIAGYTRLKAEGVDDSDLRGILSYEDKAALADKVTELAALDGMATQTFREQFSGKIGSIPTVFTQQLPTIGMGSRTNGAVNGATQNVDYVSVARSGAPGQYMTQEINIDGLGIGGTINDGEVFTIAGVEAYDNRLGASQARLQQFRVIGDATADGTGAATVRIFPALIVPGSGTGDNVNINTAHATVTAAPADGAVVTFLGTADEAYRARAIIQKQAILVNTCDLPVPHTGKMARKQLTKVPLSVRMWMDSDFATGDHRVRFDVALTANVRDRRRIVRINGTV